MYSAIHIGTQHYIVAIAIEQGRSFIGIGTAVINSTKVVVAGSGNTNVVTQVGLELSRRKRSKIKRKNWCVNYNALIAIPIIASRIETKILEL